MNKIRIIVPIIIYLSRVGTKYTVKGSSLDGIAPEGF